MFKHVMVGSVAQTMLWTWLVFVVTCLVAYWLFRDRVRKPKKAITKKYVQQLKQRTQRRYVAQGDRGRKVDKEQGKP